MIGEVMFSGTNLPRRVFERMRPRRPAEHPAGQLSIGTITNLALGAHLSAAPGTFRGEPLV